MIRTIIFDIGNVLVDFRWKEFFQDRGFEGERLARIARATVENPDWCEYDRGVLSDEEILQLFINKDPELESEIKATFENFGEMVRIRDYAIHWVKELKEKGYQVLYLSNYSEKMEREGKGALDFIPYMDGGIFSYKEKVIKPEAEIYERLIERYNLIPGESVFLDDTLVNLTAAARKGIKTILFQSREQALLELKKLGVE